MTEWFERVKARPAFKPALLDSRVPDLTADMSIYGARNLAKRRAFLDAIDRRQVYFYVGE